MPLLDAKCPNCGGALQVDQERRLAICPYCKEPYVVEEAVNNYITNNYSTTNIEHLHADVVNVTETQNVQNYLERIKEFIDTNRYERAEEYLEKVLDIEPLNEEARSLQKKANKAKRAYKPGDICVGYIESVDNARVQMRLPYAKGFVIADELKVCNLNDDIETSIRVVVTKESWGGAGYRLIPLSSKLGTMPSEGEEKVLSLTVTEYNYPFLDRIVSEHQEIREIHIEGPREWGNPDGDLREYDPFIDWNHEVEVLEIPDNIEFRSYNEADPLWPDLLKHVDRLMISEEKMIKLGWRLRGTKHYSQYLHICEGRNICPECKRPLTKKLIKGYVCDSDLCKFKNHNPFK